MCLDKVYATPMSSVANSERDIRGRESTRLIEKTAKVFFGFVSTTFAIGSLVGFAVTGHPLALCSFAFWATATVLTVGCNNVCWIAKETLKVACSVHERIFISRHHHFRVVDGLYMEHNMPTHTEFYEATRRAPVGTRGGTRGVTRGLSPAAHPQCPPRSKHRGLSPAARPEPSYNLPTAATIPLPIAVALQERAPVGERRASSTPPSSPRAPSSTVFDDATRRAPVGRRESSPPSAPIPHIVATLLQERAPVGERRESSPPSNTRFTQYPAAIPRAPSSTVYDDATRRAPVGRRESSPPSAPISPIVAAVLQERAPVGARRESPQPSSNTLFDEATRRAPVGSRR